MKQQLEQLQCLSRGTGKKVFVSKEALEFLDTDLLSLKVVREKLGPRLNVKLTKSGSEKMERMTKLWLGKEIGIFVKSKLVYRASIVEPISNDFVFINLTEQRARELGKRSGGDKYQDRPSMERSVFVGFETAIAGTKISELNYVIAPGRKDYEEDLFACKIMQEVLEELGFKTMNAEDVGSSTSLERVGFLRVDIKDIEFDRMSINVVIGRIKGAVKRENVEQLWWGIAALDPKLYLDNRKNCIKRLMSHYGDKDIKTTENW